MLNLDITRRAFAFAIGGLPCLLATKVLAQKADGIRRVGVLMSLADSDSQAKDREAVFRTALAEKGWNEGRNLSLHFRWAPGDPVIIDRQASELVRLNPHVIVAGGGPLIGPLQRATNSIPIVFTLAIDPVARGYVASLSHPGGN